MLEKMKILIISDAWHPQVNGVVRTYEHLSDELEKMGHEVKVIGPSDFSYKTSLPGYPEIKLVLFPYNKLSNMIKAFNPDIIHISVEGPLGWAGRKYCRRHNINFSTSYHTHFPHYMEERMPKSLPFLRKLARNLGVWYVKKFHNASQNLMLASPSLESVLKDWGFKNNIHRLTRGVNIDTFFPDPDIDIFKNLPKPIALYVGRVAIEKNLEAFLSMTWEGSKIIVGDGPSRSYLESKYPDAQFLGKQKGEDLANCYRSSDIFVFPSQTDTFGIVLIEALATGIPIAAYPVTGPKDIIIDDSLGYLDENLGTAAQKALESKDQDIEKRRAYVTQNYSWKAAALQFLNAPR